MEEGGKLDRSGCGEKERRLREGSLGGFDGFGVRLDAEDAEDEAAAGFFDEGVGNKCGDQEESEADRNPAAVVVKRRWTTSTSSH